jgi:mono/diheme cytochrome c family protein
MRPRFAGVVLVVAFVPGVARSQPAGGARDLGADVRSIFAQKCAGCHGPDLPRPKGRFGYVLDLRRVAGNPELLIPGRPEESELWVLVARGDMPPADSPQGTLTAAERETVRAWIAAGAPDARAPSSGLPHTPSEPGQPAAASVPSPTDRLTRLLGKLHLLLLHFPIALVIAAGVSEFLPSRRGAGEPSPATQFCLTLAAVVVVPTVILGWLHAAGGNGAGSLLTLHRWLGTLTGVWVVVAALYARRVARRGVRSWLVRGTLVIAILLIVATAHAGGLLAHGSNFYDW